MNNQDYTATIKVTKYPSAIFKHINDVSKWWTKDFEGQSTKLNDEFINHGDPHYSKQKLIEIIPDKKIVWLVTDSKLNWIEKDKHEWTGTKMIFELAPEGDNTLLKFTHQGLVPEKECYERCALGWNMVIKERLFNFITDDKTI
ncbi:MAG TPA: SRPBCC domain-containing protein [Chitinophagales bacterium]|nr:SRPBCC domain-containing protein [Chitinophagales bacterium]